MDETYPETYTALPLYMRLEPVNDAKHALAPDLREAMQALRLLHPLVRPRRLRNTRSRSSERGPYNIGIVADGRSTERLDLLWSRWS